MQSVNFSDYDLSTGAILYSSVCYGREPALAPGMGRKYGKRDASRYFVNLDTQRFNKRKPFKVQAVRSDNHIRLSLLPVATEVWLEGECFEVADGVFELMLDQPVSVSMLLKHVHYLDRVIAL